jgi:uncharacterized membrane protein
VRAGDRCGIGNVGVTDDKCAPVTAVESGGFNVGDANTDGLLDPGESWSFECSVALTEDTTNTGTVTADDSNGDPVSDFDTETVNVINPAVGIVKTADDLIATNGQTVTYGYAVTNPGDDPLSNVGVTDDKCVESGGFNVGDTNTDGLLDPGESWSFECSVALTEDTTNTGTVTADDSNGDPVSDFDTETVNVINPAVGIVKTADSTTVTSGETVVYSYDVANPGDDPLSNVGVTDDKCAPVTAVESGGFNVGDANTDGLLDPSETWNFECSVALTETTTNTGTVTADDSNGDPVSDFDTETVTVI